MEAEEDSPTIQDPEEELFLCNHCGEHKPISERAGGESKHYHGGICESCFQKEN